MIETVELTDAEWTAERNAVLQRFGGISADEFVDRYRRGCYEIEEPDWLMLVLAYFPELD